MVSYRRNAEVRHITPCVCMTHPRISPDYNLVQKFVRLHAHIVRVGDDAADEIIAGVWRVRYWSV